MAKLFFIMILFCISLSPISHGRKPAVEQQVIIDSPSDVPIRPGEESRVNFSPSKERVKSDSLLGYELSQLFFLLTLLSLPFASWFIIARNHDRKEIARAKNNIEVLSQYQMGENNYNVKPDDDDDIPKAS